MDTIDAGRAGSDRPIIGKSQSRAADITMSFGQVVGSLSDNPNES